MRNRSKRRMTYPCGPLYLAAIAALSGANIAGAADTASVATQLKTLADFPNVRVVNAPELATPPAKTPGQAGRRIYIDPETGKPRPPTPEELAAERLEAQTAAASKPQGAVEEQPPFEGLYGGIRYHAGESQMVFSVVRRQENGELAEFCVVGPEQAAKVMEHGAGALPRKGDRHDR